MCTAVVGPANAAADVVRECDLDRIGRPLSGFVEQGAGHRSKSVSRHLVFAEPHPSQRHVDRVLGHRTNARIKRREDIFLVGAQRLRRLYNRDSLL